MRLLLHLPRGFTWIHSTNLLSCSPVPSGASCQLRRGALASLADTSQGASWPAAEALRRAVRRCHVILRGGTFSKGTGSKGEWAAPALIIPLRCHASPAPPPSATILRCALSRRALRFSGQGGFAIADFAAVASAMKVATATPAHASLAQEAVKATAGARAAASAAAQALAEASIPQAPSVWVKEAATQKGGDAVALAQRQSGGNPFARGARAPHAPIPAPARRLGPCPEVSLPLEGAIPPRIPPLCVAACLRLVEMGCAVSREQPPRGITACTPSPHPQKERGGAARARAA